MNRQSIKGFNLAALPIPIYSYNVFYIQLSNMVSYSTSFQLLLLRDSSVCLTLKMKLKVCLYIVGPPYYNNKYQYDQRRRLRYRIIVQSQRIKCNILFPRLLMCIFTYIIAIIASLHRSPGIFRDPYNLSKIFQGGQKHNMYSIYQFRLIISGNWLSFRM